MFFSCSHLALCFTCSLESVFCAFLLHLQHFCSFAHNLLVLYIYINLSGFMRTSVQYLQKLGTS